jgi:hypothetical protein
VGGWRFQGNRRVPVFCKVSGASLSSQHTKFLSVLLFSLIDVVSFLGISDLVPVFDPIPILGSEDLFMVLQPIEHLGRFHIVLSLFG